MSKLFVPPNVLSKNKYIMFGLFKKDPAKKLYSQYEALMEKARDVQRSGDLRHYARIMEESEAILARIDAIKNENPDT